MCAENMLHVVQRNYLMQGKNNSVKPGYILALKNITGITSDKKLSVRDGELHTASAI